MSERVLVETVGDKLMIDPITLEAIHPRRPQVRELTAFIEGRETQRPDSTKTIELRILAHDVKFTDEQFKKVYYEELAKTDSYDTDTGAASREDSDKAAEKAMKRLHKAPKKESKPSEDKDKDKTGTETGSITSGS